MGKKRKNRQQEEKKVNRNIKKLICSGLAFCQIVSMTLMTAYARPDWPSDVGIQAEAGTVMDVDSGTVIFGQNSHVEYPPASITKILTALLVLENANLSDTVTFSETAINSVEPDSGNKLSLVAGDTMTVEECLYSLLLVSVNQSANALAEHVAGSIPAFVDMMNQKLVELGCTESHFENPSGLNGDTQNVSAYDMAKIACAAYSNESLLKISSTVSYKISSTSNNPDGITIRNEHRLVITEDSSSEFYCPEAVAGKPGYLLKAGNTLVTYGEKDGRRLVSVILKGSPRQYFLDGKELLQFGFSRFYNVDIAENETRYVTGEEPTEINGVSYAPSDLYVETGRMITLPNSASFGDAELSLAEMPEDHPVNAVALLQYVYNERKIGQAYLCDRAIPVPDEAGSSSEGEGNSLEMMEMTTTASETNTPEGEADVPVSGDPNEEKLPETLRELPLLPMAAVLVFIVLATGTGFWIRESRRKEAEAQALRRERRRQRLREEGVGAEAEFERLMEEKRNRNKDRR